MIELHTLQIGYKDKFSFTIDNLSLSKAAITCLIGENGSGKSTLLKSILGIQKPLEGQIIIDGKLISEYTKKELARKMAIVLTRNTDTPQIKAYELIEIGTYPLKNVSKQRKKQLVDKAVSFMGIENLTHRYCTELSDGQLQKIYLARALAQDTPILLLDEPSSFLDEKYKFELYKLLIKLCKQENKTILFSSHDLQNIVHFADEIWEIKEGQVSKKEKEELQHSLNFIKQDFIDSL